MRALRIAGYVAFGLVSLLVSLYLTFPWDAVKDRVLGLASEKLGRTLEARSLEPHWLTGVKVEGLTIRDPRSPEPLEIDSLTVRARLLKLLTGKLGFSAAAPVAKGRIELDVARAGDTTEVEARLETLELALLPALAEKLGLPLGGTLAGGCELSLDAKDASQTSGSLTLTAADLATLPGAKVKGISVPELRFGALDWTIPVTKGKAKLEKLESKGEDVELRVEGEITLQNPLDRSMLNLTVGFRPTEALLKREPILNALLANIASAKGGDGFYSFAANGLLRDPRFVPRRR